MRERKSKCDEKSTTSWPKSQNLFWVIHVLCESVGLGTYLKDIGFLVILNMPEINHCAESSVLL